MKRITLHKDAGEFAARMADNHTIWRVGKNLNGYGMHAVVPDVEVKRRRSRPP
jgi:hypothetical protein